MYDNNPCENENITKFNCQIVLDWYYQWYFKYIMYIEHWNYPYTDTKIQYYELHESYIVTKSVTDASVDAPCLGSSFQLVSRFDLLYSSFTNSSRGKEIHVDIIKA